MIIIAYLQCTLSVGIVLLHQSYLLHHLYLTSDWLRYTGSYRTVDTLSCILVLIVIQNFHTDVDL